jgi:hypothetical protein
MKHLVLLALLLMYTPVFAQLGVPLSNSGLSVAPTMLTTIQLTQPQIDKVKLENCQICEICEVCPEPPIDPPPIDPPPIDPPPADCQDTTTLQGSAKAWTAVFYQSFPGPTYENVMNIVIPQRGFWSVAFNTGSARDNGKLSLLENSASPGIRKGSISKCLGDFHAPPAECKYSWGLGGGILWATDGKAGACQLERGELYYFNVTYTNGVSPATSQCRATPCRINLQHYNF